MLFKNVILSWLLTAFVALSGAGTLGAQTEKGVQFSCVIWQPLKFDELFYQDKNQYLPLILKKGTRSQPQKFSSSQPLRIFIRKEVDGKTVYELVGEGKAPSKSRRLLFLIGENTIPSGLPLQVIGVDDSTESFPPGTYKFMNFTTATLEIEIFGTKERIAPKAISVVKPNIPENGGFLPFYVRSNPKTIIYKTRLLSQRGERKMVFLFPGSKKRPLLLKFLAQ